MVAEFDPERRRVLHALRLPYWSQYHALQVRSSAQSALVLALVDEVLERLLESECESVVAGKRFNEDAIHVCLHAQQRRHHLLILEDQVRGVKLRSQTSRQDI